MWSFLHNSCTCTSTVESQFLADMLCCAMLHQIHDKKLMFFILRNSAKLFKFFKGQKQYIDFYQDYNFRPALVESDLQLLTHISNERCSSIVDWLPELRYLSPDNSLSTCNTYICFLSFKGYNHTFFVHNKTEIIVLLFS